MTAIQWDTIGERYFEAGIDKAVLYDPDGIGIPWNGIVSVEEENNTEVEGAYFDGLKFNDLVTLGEFSGTIRAFTYPDEFQEYDGLREDQLGVLIADQTPKRFHLCYRTRVGNDLEGADYGYKIHIIWNLTANAAVRNWESLGLEVEPLEFEWAITAIPEEIAGHRPTAHIILDTRKLDPWLLVDLEEILYGNETDDARLPSLQALTTFIRKWNRLIIVDNNDGTWTAISQSDDVITVDEFGVITIIADDDQVEIIDPDTYTIQSSEKNDEDV